MVIDLVRLNSEYFQGSRFCNSHVNMRTRYTFPITEQGETSLESKDSHFLQIHLSKVFMTGVHLNLIVGGGSVLFIIFQLMYNIDLSL